MWRRRSLPGASRAVCPVPLIVAAEGDDVTLQCHLVPEVNAVDHTIDWMKDDVLRVHVRRHGEPNEADQRPEYRNRTRDDPEGLKRGNLSLVLYSVKQSDSGSYRCFDATMNSFCYLNLTVGDQQLVCLGPITAPEGAEVTLRCSSDPKLPLEGYTVEVRRDDNFVHLYRDGKDDFVNQMRQYRNRTALDHGDLLSGNITLRISSVHESDGGRFTVFIRQLNTSSVIDLTVEAKDPKNRTKRLDSTTTVPPTEDPGAEKKTDGGMSVRSHLGVLPAVVLLAAAAAFLLRRYLIDKNSRRRRPNNNEPVTMVTVKKELEEDALGAGEASFKLMVDNNEHNDSGKSVY